MQSHIDLSHIIFISFNKLFEFAQLILSNLLEITFYHVLSLLLLYSFSFSLSVLWSFRLRLLHVPSICTAFIQISGQTVPEGCIRVPQCRQLELGKAFNNSNNMQ